MPTFDTPNSTQTYTLPTYGIVEVYGAGGADSQGDNTESGGSGGYASIVVTEGTTLVMDIGEGGSVPSGGLSPAGDGGDGGSSPTGETGGGGGGTTVVTRQSDSTELVEAGAGGGAGALVEALQDYDSAGGGGGARGGLGGDGNPSGGDRDGEDAQGSGVGGDGGFGGDSQNQAPEPGEDGGVTTASGITVNSTQAGGGAPAGQDGYVEITLIYPPPDPILSIDDVRADEIDTSWTEDTSGDTSPADGWRVYLSDDDGATFTEIADITTQSYTLQNLDNGTEYQIYIEAYNDGGTTTSDTLSATTVLPDEDQPVLGNGIEDEISVDRESAVSNTGSVRYQIRETGQTTWDSSATGFAETVEDFDTLSFIFTGLEDGEEYEVRGRTETDDVTGTYTQPVAITTDFPGVTNLTITNTTATSVSLEWTDNADNEDGFRVERRDRTLNTVGNWEVIETLDPNPGTGTVTYSDTTVESGSQYDYRVETFTEHTSVVSSNFTAVTDFEQLGLLLGEPRNLLQIPHDEILESPGIDITKTHTGIADFQISLVGNPDIRDFVARQDTIRLQVSSGIEFIGYCTNLQTDYRNGNSLLSGFGVAKRLEETRPDYESLGGSLTYSNIAVEDAIRDYWSRTPFDNYTVYPQDTELVGENQEVQSASAAGEFSAITSIPSDVPLEAGGGVLQTLKVCNTLDAETQTNDGVEVNNGDYNADFSGGTAIELSGNGEGVTFDIDVEYDIDQFDLTYNFRVLENNLDSDVRVFFNGSEATSFSVSDTSSLAWQYSGALNDSAISTGANQATIELDNYSSGELVVDVGAFYDLDYPPPSFDNSTDANGALAEPGEYPESISTVFEEIETGFNITEGTVNLTEDSGRDIDEIAISFDGGSTFKTATNTLSATFSPDGATRFARTRLTLSGYSSGNLQTPTNRDVPHEIETYELLVDLNDLVVIDEIELSQDHFTNQKTLHDYGDYLWNIEHADEDISNLNVESFQRGTQTKTLPVDKKIDQTSEVAAEAYYNRIYLQGALVNGDRPSAEVENTSEIESDRGAITPGVLRDLDIVTEAGAEFRARALLDRAALNNAVRGQQTYPADLSIQPGFAYPTSFGEGEQEFTLEEVSLTFSGSDATVLLDFVPEQSLAEDISELRRASRQQSDRV